MKLSRRVGSVCSYARVQGLPMKGSGRGDLSVFWGEEIMDQLSHGIGLSFEIIQGCVMKQQSRVGRAWEVIQGRQAYPTRH